MKAMRYLRKYRGGFRTAWTRRRCRNPVGRGGRTAIGRESRKPGSRMCLLPVSCGSDCIRRWGQLV